MELRQAFKLPFYYASKTDKFTSIWYWLTLIHLSKRAIHGLGGTRLHQSHVLCKVRLLLLGLGLDIESDWQDP